MAICPECKHKWRPYYDEPPDECPACGFTYDDDEEDDDKEDTMSMFSDMLTVADQSGRLHTEIGRLQARLEIAIDGLKMIRDVDPETVRSHYYLIGMASGVLMRLQEEDALGIDKEESDEA